MSRAKVLLLVGACCTLSSSATAQLWDPLDVIPRSNAVVAFDNSVTMVISEGAVAPDGLCSYLCHLPGVTEGWGRLPFEETRHFATRQTLNEVLPLFERYFDFGGMVYSSCGSAHIQNRVLPDDADPAGSLARTLTMLDDVNMCLLTEWDLPDELGGFDACLLPGCPDDNDKLDRLVNEQELFPGLWMSPLQGSVTCDRASSSEFEAYYGFGFSPGEVVDTRQIFKKMLRKRLWHLGGAMSALDPDYLGERISREANTTKWELSNNASANCQTQPNYDVWDLWFDGWAATSACDAGNWAADTCLCHNRYATDPSCYSGNVLPRDPCGAVLTWSQRQQAMFCDLVRAPEPGSFPEFFQNQTDNRVHIDQDPNACRENIALVVTDSIGGDVAGLGELAAKLAPVFDDNAGGSNLYVLHATDIFMPTGDDMTRLITGGRRTTREDGRNNAALTTALVRILNQSLSGHYAASPAAIGEGRLALVSSWIPGRNPDPAVPNNEYFGRPLRLSIHSLDEKGAISTAPVWESDWAAVAGSIGPGAPASNPVHYLCPGADTLVDAAPGAASPCGASDVAAIGPYGAFFDSRPRAFAIPNSRMDRNGDGTADTHPALGLGTAFGPGSSRPLLVGRPAGLDHMAEPGWPTYASHAAILGRPLVAYMISNGYLHAIHAGEPDLDATHFEYLDDVNLTHTGREIFRYRPPWLETAAGMPMNAMIQQPLFTGQLHAREMPIRARSDVSSDAEVFGTLLAMNQGFAGRGYSVLEVTNPFAPTVYREQTLPVETAAVSEPTLQAWPDAQSVRPVILIGGGSNRIYFWDLRPNTLTPIDLNGAQVDEYWTAPACISTSNRGSADYCYVLGRFGTLFRLEVSEAGFTRVDEVTPSGANDVEVRGGGREYWTSPAVFYDTQNNIGLLFGSGNPRSLVRTTPVEQRYFRLRDNFENQRPSGLSLTGRDVCVPDGSGSRLGQFELGGQELLSPPVVRRGVVSFTTYDPSAKTCLVGNSYLYSLRFQDCRDANVSSPSDRPVAVPIGQGIASSPLVHVDSGIVFTRTSDQIAASSLSAEQTLQLGGGAKPLRFLFWRVLTGNL